MRVFLRLLMLLLMAEQTERWNRFLGLIPNIEPPRSLLLKLIYEYRGYLIK
jgi:hypothetical protein